ncbi:ABC transporter permease [Sphingomonas sp. KRR8]|uniref:ABC transporter permease n=1 Tax=Sphingomonas sp. KRR8 TaxID=2942996 RepID=UPI00202175A9|nr:ABC transporter permease [Sphingomonas sp. KRR8]URD60447.1 ABC transporter permease [Sphingomonas sp. KRR8]
MSLSRTLQSALVIGRRDYTATVVSRAFLLFLLGPMFPVIFGGLFGSIGASVASRAEQATVVAIATADQGQRLDAARDEVARALAGSEVFRLRIEAPDGSGDAQVDKLLASPDRPVTAVLQDPFDGPQLVGKISDPLAGQVRLILAQAARGGSTPEVTVHAMAQSSGSTASARTLTAHAGQILIFFLTIMLAGMLLSQLLEEKSNKVIEVLAAAVPVDAIFLGKLFAMLSVSLTAIAVWAGLGFGALLLFTHGSLGALPPPAVGWPGFIGLTLMYFCFGYLLLGGLFLGIGAQASTVRQVQTLSMPITMSQLLIFALSATAASDPGSTAGLVAAVFPLSSPYAMLARAAQDPRWWPHLVAFGWQALWLVLILRLVARMFRRSVLKSGRQGSWFRRARPA